MPWFEQDAQNAPASGVTRQNARGRVDRISQLAAHVAQALGSPSQAKPSDDLWRRAFESQSFGCRSMEDAVISLGQVQLRPRCRLAILPRQEGRSSRENATFAPLIFRSLREGVQNRFLPSPDEERGDGNGP